MPKTSRSKIAQAASKAKKQPTRAAKRGHAAVTKARSVGKKTTRAVTTKTQKVPATAASLRSKYS